MKKIIGLIVLVSILAATQVKAQYNQYPQPQPYPSQYPSQPRPGNSFRFYDMRFGVFLSPTWSWLTTDNKDINSAGSELGIKLGVIAEYRLSEAYSISTGINASYNAGGTIIVNLPNHLWQKANKEFFPTPNDTLTYQDGSKFTYTLAYFEIPIGLKLRTPESGDHIRWFAEPHIAFGVKSNGGTGKTVGLGFGGIYDQEKIPIRTEVNTFDFSFGIGAGGEYIITNNTALIFGLYYQSGLFDISENNSGVIYSKDGTNRRLDTSSTWNNSIALRVGIMF